MKIIVKGTDHNIRLGLPTGLLLNRVSAHAISKEAKKYGVTLTYSQTVKLIKAINAYRRAHKEWILAEVSCADGEYVLVKL